MSRNAGRARTHGPWWIMECWLWRVGARPAGQWRQRLPGAGGLQDQARDTCVGRLSWFGGPPPNPSFPMATCGRATAPASGPAGRKVGPRGFSGAGLGVRPCPVMMRFRVIGDLRRQAEMSDTLSFSRRDTEAPRENSPPPAAPGFRCPGASDLTEGRISVAQGVEAGMKWGGILDKVLELLRWGREFVHGIGPNGAEPISPLAGEMSAQQTEGGMVASRP